MATESGTKASNGDTVSNGEEKLSEVVAILDAGAQYGKVLSHVIIVNSRF